MCQRRVLPQNIHRLDRCRACTACLLIATAGQKCPEREDHSDKNTETFSAFKQIKNLLFPFPTNVDAKHLYEEGQGSAWDSLP